MNKPETKKNTRTSKPHKRKKQTASRKRRVLFFLLKLFLVLIVLIAAYGVYLDQKIRERIDGSVWELPVAVYGQIVNLEPGEAYSQDDIISILNGAQYRQVRIVTRPGEFVVDQNNIEIYRRPFSFPDGEESAFKVKISFTAGLIGRIYNLDNGRDFGFFRIDPKLITMLRSPNGEQRLVVALKNYPDSLLKILIETEDRRFYEHDGVSLYSIGRAIWANFSSGRAVQGGSTLTQQLVKNLFLTNERSLTRKLREAYMAVILEARYSKEKILELYLNEVYLGQSGDEEIHGFPLASLYYFGRPVQELTFEQQALLVGIVKGASYYNPWNRPERAMERRNVVLQILEQREVIDAELYQILSQRPLGVLPKGGVISPQPAFMQLVRRELREKLGDRADNMSGMKVFTTFDPNAQNAAEQAVVDQVEVLRKAKNKPDLEASMVVVNRQTGEIKAVIGSAQPQYAGFNRALLGRRQIGSLAKPPTYLTALSNPEQYRLNTWLEDNPLSIKLDNGTIWQPNNYDRQYRGRVMLVDALANSLNIPSIHLGMQLGFKATEDTLKVMGVPPAVIKPLLSRYIGAIELTPLEVAQMYQVMANNGNKADLSVLRFVMDEKGSVVYQSYPQARQVLSPQASYLTLYAMQQVVNYGSARSLSSLYGQYHLAGKTGSTNDLKDSWFTGIDGKDVAVIWVGLDDHKPINLTGSSGSLTVYRQYLSHYSPQVLQPAIPANIQFAPIGAEGAFLCSGSGVRTLPVWTTNLQSICVGATAQPEQLKEQAPGWLKALFST
ncbi:bifunctional glycosyl transferase/transpeptidase [Utexia brackfieldae]|uniref:bifunctional glycosyl transferase/transpeptidase n=1 Tax=Utexia brackfieldae TaxID=3074108 RepID=UPI00370DD8B4